MSKHNDVIKVVTKDGKLTHEVVATVNAGAFKCQLGEVAKLTNFELFRSKRFGYIWVKPVESNERAN